MTEEEYFRKTYPDYCYGDRLLSPYWDLFQDGTEFGERQSEKQIEELERENEQLKSTAEFQQSSNMKRHFEIQKLEKENAGLKAGRPQWHLTKNELPELQTTTDTGDEYNTLVLCFWYVTDSRGNKTKVYDLDRWYPENDIWESGKQRDEVEAWMYLPEPPEEI